MSIKIKHIKEASLLDTENIKPGDLLISINGNLIKDKLDYTFYASESKLSLKLKRKNKLHTIELEKDFYQDLGLEFYPMKFRNCACNCIFCFIDQMHTDSRSSLKIKDDDYRLSFLFGNFITLVNLNQNDYKRILEQKLSPLYISVHTTNDKLRQKMMRYKGKFSIMERLQFLAKNDIMIHTQIVLVPGYNDGKNLEKTIQDLEKLYPQVNSIGIVPVGLTKFRANLPKINTFKAEDCRQIIKLANKYREEFLQKHGSGIVQLADEFYLLANKTIPDAHYYEGYAQLENGIGMVRQFVNNADGIIDEIDVRDTTNSITLITANLAYPIIKKFAEKVSKFYDISVYVVKVKNKYLGEEVTVSGLLSASDVIEAIKDDNKGDLILLPKNMFNSDQVTLDDKRVADIKRETGTEIQVL